MQRVLVVARRVTVTGLDMEPETSGTPRPSQRFRERSHGEFHGVLQGFLHRSGHGRIDVRESCQELIREKRGHA